MALIAPGDVLLVRGRGFLSKAIRFLDGSEVNHVAIALTEEQLAEATAHGLDVALIDVAIERSELVIVSRVKDGDPAPAVAQARGYLGDGVPYAYHQLLLLAGLCLTRRIPINNRLFRRVVRRALDAAAELLNAIVDRGADLMICSEYVYRCYRAGGVDLLPQGIPDLAGAAAADGVVLLDWLDRQPAVPEQVTLPAGPVPDLVGGRRGTPVAATVPVEGPADIATIAERAEYELDELVAEYFASEGDSATGLVVATAAADVVEDEELVAAATRLAQAAARVEGRRGGGSGQPRAQGLVGPGDVVRALSGVFSTNANFVTPRDLLQTSTLEQVHRLP